MMHEMEIFMKKTVLITGASRGIGAATALEFAKNGYNLVLICKSSIDKLNIIANLVKDSGVNCYTFQGDISNAQVVSV